MNQILILLCIGFAAGLASGVMGIGGGLIMVPALVLILGLSQHLAQGTSLAVMIPPVGLLAAWKYYQSGNLDIKMALWIAGGFILGAFWGATLIQPITDTNLRRLFGFIMAAVSLKMIWGK